jgi:hypothetical protein
MAWMQLILYRIVPWDFFSAIWENKGGAQKHGIMDQAFLGREFIFIWGTKTLAFFVWCVNLLKERVHLKDL